MPDSWVNGVGVVRAAMGTAAVVVAATLAACTATVTVESREDQGAHASATSKDGATSDGCSTYLLIEEVPPGRTSNTVAVDSCGDRPPVRGLEWVTGLDVDAPTDRVALDVLGGLGTSVYVGSLAEYLAGGLDSAAADLEVVADDAWGATFDGNVLLYFDLQRDQGIFAVVRDQLDGTEPETLGTFSDTFSPGARPAKIGQHVVYSYGASGFQNLRLQCLPGPCHNIFPADVLLFGPYISRVDTSGEVGAVGLTGHPTTGVHVWVGDDVHSLSSRWRLVGRQDATSGVFLVVDLENPGAIHRVDASGDVQDQPLFQLDGDVYRVERGS